MKIFSLPIQFLALSAMIFLLTFLFLPMRFEENDDIVMMLLASGVYSGEPSSNLVFINYILGVALSSLYQVMPELDWYPGTMLFALSACCALGAITAIDRFRTKQAVNTFAFTVFGGLALCIIIQMQFTTAAAFTGAVGAWVVLTGRTRTLRLIGAALVLYGFLLRFDAAMLVLLVGSPFFVLAIWRQTNVLRCWLGLAGLVVIGLGLHVYSERAYQSLNPAYVAFNDVRGKVNDNPNAVLASEILPDEISANDFALLVEFFPDPLEINQADLEAIHAAVIQKEQSLTLGDWFHAFKKLLSRTTVQLVVVTLLVLVSVVPGRIQKLVLLAACITFLAPLLYVSVFALLKERVVLAAVASVISGLFFLNLQLVAKRTAWMAYLSLIWVSLFFLLESKDRLISNLRVHGQFFAQSEIIQMWDGSVFVYANAVRVQYSRLFTNDLDPLLGKVFFAGWMTLHPDNSAYESHQSLLAEDAALLLFADAGADAKITLILTALEENYGVRAVAEVVAQNDSGLLLTFRPSP
ncbi:hypothetical protein [Yoonia sp. SDW83-1]|uniref:hypothetical protein n=1 Tax=Yoonia sp. SDW83-1 TaxID=3366945 RepID=UPI00398C4156